LLVNLPNVPNLSRWWQQFPATFQIKPATSHKKSATSLKKSVTLQIKSMAVQVKNPIVYSMTRKVNQFYRDYFPCILSNVALSSIILCKIFIFPIFDNRKDFLF
jgi:hypothetical protein